MLPQILATAASMGGNLLNYLGQNDANRRNQDSANIANASQREIAMENIRAQKEYAQNSIRWKMADAVSAGLHPTMAIGAQGYQFSPVSIGTHTPHMENALGGAAQMGQDISRSVLQGMDREEQGRVALAAQEKMDGYNTMKMAQDLEKGDLQNELLRLQINNARPQVGGPPSLTPNKLSSTEPIPVPELAYGYTDSGGLAPIPSESSKTRTEDSPWAIEHWWRNRVLNFAHGPKYPHIQPPPGHYWKWSPLKGEFYPESIDNEYKRNPSARKKFWWEGGK